MHNGIPADDSGNDTLAWQALLYASGELEGEPETSFEERLGADQSARDALCQAVQLTMALGDQVPVRPNPAYRQRVKQRLREKPSFWYGLTGRRTYRGHPALWGGLGAAAAVLLMLGLGQATPLFQTAPAPTIAAPTPPNPDPTPVEHGTAVATLEEANTWAELSNRDHLEKARAEEFRRKNRAQELQRLVKPKNEDRRHRLLGNPATKY